MARNLGHRSCQSFGNFEIIYTGVVRVNRDGGTGREYFSWSPSQHHRSRPGLQSGTGDPHPLDANLDHPSKTTEVLSSGAFDLWDDLTIPEICSDPLGHLPRTHIFRNIVEFFVVLAHGRDP